MHEPTEINIKSSYSLDLVNDLHEQEVYQSEAPAIIRGTTAKDRRSVEDPNQVYAQEKEDSYRSLCVLQ